MGSVEAVVGLWGGVRAAVAGAERAGRGRSGVQEQEGQGLETHLVFGTSRGVRSV